MSRSGIWLRAPWRGYDGRRHRRRERDVYGRAIVIACVTALAVGERDGVRRSECEGRRRDRRLPEAGQGVPPRGARRGRLSEERAHRHVERAWPCRPARARPACWRSGAGRSPGPKGDTGAAGASRSGRPDRPGRCGGCGRPGRSGSVRRPRSGAQGPAGPQGPAGAASLGALDGSACTRHDGSAGTVDVVVTSATSSSFAAWPATLRRRLRPPPTRRS